MKQIRPLIAALLTMVWAWSTLVVPLPAAELDEAEFRRLHELLRPDENEPWRTIPWKIDLLDAQRTAAQRRQPLFIWAMDGHPLGCT